MPNFERLAAAANIARGLAMDAVQACASGHLGLPLGAAEIGAVLYGELLRHDPADPAWINRDRFVLSAGHGSMFLYAWLHLCGYPLSLDEIRHFRQWGSKTPGHPEFSHTPGVEATTGPLGQGVGNAVGQAVAARMMAARFNTAEHAIFDHTIWALAGDGCMQEGVASEAAAMAGHFGLDNLILIYDSNFVTLDAMAAKSQSEDTAKRFEAYGYEVLHIDKGNDLVMVGLDVIRPADPEETAGAWLAAIEHTEGPTVLALTRQAVPMLPGAALAKREGILRGGYVLVQESAPLDTILIATGSEVQHAVAAARELGPGTRVVSLPCFSRFERQPADYHEAVLPSACERRVSIEAGVTFGWRAFVGSRGRMVGIDRFGASAPGNVVMEELGMTKAAVVAAARAL